MLLIIGLAGRVFANEAEPFFFNREIGLCESRAGSLEVRLGHPGIAEHQRDMIGWRTVKVLGGTNAHAMRQRLGHQCLGGTAWQLGQVHEERSSGHRGGHRHGTAETPLQRNVQGSVAGSQTRCRFRRDWPSVPVFADQCTGSEQCGTASALWPKQPIPGSRPATSADSNELGPLFQQVAWQKLELARDAARPRLDCARYPFRVRRHRRLRVEAGLCPNRCPSAEAQHGNGNAVFPVR